MSWVLVKDIRLPLAESSAVATEFAQRKLAALVGRENVGASRIYRKSVDARHRDRISIVWSAAVEISELPKNDALEKAGITPLVSDEVVITHGTKPSSGRPLVVGFGPAGMFAALILAENGYRPIVIERGDDTPERIKAVNEFYTSGRLDTESNIQFGAGGAGTFSDGKLVTRVNDSRCGYVLKRFVEFGAPEDILTEAKPHVGTDLLTGIVDGIKNEIVKLGGEVMFRCALRSFKTDSAGNITSALTTRGEIACGSVVLASGHSARDVYAYLGKSGYAMEEKAVSVGLRIEHLRSAVEKAIYGDAALRLAEKDPEIKRRLGSAEYAYSLRENDRAVYTFCMCPGGEVVAGASEECALVVNGMSRSARDGRNSNSALCVSVTPEDCRAFGGTLEFCRRLERRAYVLGGGGYRAPVETVGDFLSGSRAPAFPSEVVPTYMGDHGNILPARLETIFPDFVSEMLRRGIRAFGRRMQGFDSPGAVLTGAETRTSAPYRIIRGETGSAPGHPNLYPCGEGAGYAGGITSAALDGIKQAERIISLYAPYAPYADYPG